MRSKTSLFYIAGAYDKFCHLVEHLKSPFLLLIRLYWGWQLFQTGQGKLANIEKVAGFFDSLGIPYAMHNAYLVSSLESIGGLCLMLGFASRLVSVPLTVILVTAYCTAHAESLPLILSAPKEFVTQSPFPFLFTVLVVLIFGPGTFSLDGALRRYFSKRIMEEPKVTL